MDLRGQRNVGGITAVVVIVMCLLAGMPAAGGSPTTKTVGRDPAGDWGGVPGISPVGATAGQDLLEASISLADEETLHLTLEVTELPPRDAISTASAVYEWNFKIGEQLFGIYGPCQAHIYGECESATDPLAFVIGDFSGGRDLMEIAEIDDDENRIIFPIPREFIGAESGVVIEPRPAEFHDARAAVVAHTVYFVNGPGNAHVSPRDVLTVTKNYRVP